MKPYRRWLLVPILACASFLTVLAIRHYTLEKNNERSLAQATTRIVLARYAQDFDAQKAQEGLLEALKEDRSYLTPQFYMGFLDEQQEDWESAISSFENLCKLAPGSRHCAIARLELKRLAEVRTDSPQALREFRYSQKILTAKAALNSGSLKRAVFVASQASAIDDTRWEAYGIGAGALAKQKQFDEAAKFLRMAMSRAPADAKPKLQAAIDQCGKEKQYAAFALAGAQALQAKQYQTAAQQFENAWKLFPDRAEYRFAEALALANSGNHDKAVGTIVLLEGSHDPATAKKARDMLAQLSSVRTSSVASSTRHAPHTRHVTHTTITKGEPF